MRPHVLVARLDNVGDVLLAGPAVRAIAAGARRVTLWCGPRGRAAAELLPGVDAVLEHRADWIDPAPRAIDRRSVLALVDRLSALGADQSVVLTSFHQSPLPAAMAMRMAGVPGIAAISEDYPGSLLDVRHRVPDDIHEVERGLSLAAALGYRLPPDDDGRLAILRGPRPALELPSRYIAVHPGASVPARAWPAERHAHLVRALVERGHSVVVTGAGPERALTAAVAGRSRRGVRDLGGLTDLATLAEVVAGADALVAGNTGPAHVAAAVGTPVVSLYAPTVPAVRWRPWGVPHVLLGAQDVACAGCRAQVCPVPGHPCLSSVAVTDVLAALDELTAGEHGGIRPRARSVEAAG